MALMFPTCYRHPRKSGRPGWPREPSGSWIPAFAGETRQLLTFEIQFPVRHPGLIIHSALGEIPHTKRRNHQ